MSSHTSQHSNMSQQQRQPITPDGLALVRGGTERDVARLVAIGGRVLATGDRIVVKEWAGVTLDLPYALVSVGRQRVLVLLS